MGKNIHMALETQAKHRLMIFQDSFCLSCWLWSVSVHHLQGSMILSDISSGESLWLESGSILRPCTLQLQFYWCVQVTHRPTEDLYSRAPSAGPKAKLQQKKRKIFAVFQVFFYTVIFVDSWVSAFMDITSDDILRKSKVLLHSFKRSVMWRNDKKEWGEKSRQVGMTHILIIFKLKETGRSQHQKTEYNKTWE